MTIKQPNQRPSKKKLAKLEEMSFGDFMCKKLAEQIREYNEQGGNVMHHPEIVPNEVKDFAYDPLALKGQKR